MDLLSPEAAVQDPEWGSEFAWLVNSDDKSNTIDEMAADFINKN